MSTKISNIALAVDELLDNIEVADCIDVLDELFECWLANEQTDGYVGAERMIRFENYKNLRKFLNKISD